MRIIIDALPINHLSGKHVLLGHLTVVAEAQRDRHQFFILHHANNKHLCCDLGPNIQWIECRFPGERWHHRLLWQLTQLSLLLDHLGADWLVSTSGGLIPCTKLPQIVLALNPWCYFPQFHHNAFERLKANAQRFSYRLAQHKAEMIFYLSDYLEKAYTIDAQCSPKRSGILYAGIDESTFISAKNYLSFEQRNLEILTVSVMAPHKVIEDIIHVFLQVQALGIAARLTLVGPWAYPGYRAEIQRLVDYHKLSQSVTFTGQVTKAELHEYYRNTRVFCLLSRCESFGIPAIEAQAFGTPVIVADVCAPPDIIGTGGVAIATGNMNAAATALVKLLTEPETWLEASTNALANVERFRWSKVSEPLNNFLASLGNEQSVASTR